MVTRSQKNKNKNKHKDKNKPKLNHNNGDKGDTDDIDEHGNLSNFIDYKCDEPVDNKMLNNEILRLRNPTSSLITELLVSSIFLDYKNKKKRLNKKPKKNKGKKFKNKDKLSKHKSKQSENKDIIVIDNDDTINNELTNNELTNNELSDNNYSDNELSDNNYSDNELSDNELSDNELSDNELSINNYSDNELSDNELSDNNYSDDELTNNELSNNQLINRNNSNIHSNNESEYDSDSEYNSDSSIEYDEYDDEYEKILDESNYHDEDENIEYFHKLDTTKKEMYLKQLKEINSINESNVPLKFKILNSNLDIQTKSIAINNINKYCDIETSNGEFVKMEQWINGLIKIPIGKYKELPINNDSSSNDKQEYFKKVKDTLDESIYGHEEAKYYILQTIGKWVKDPISSGNVLALQGPMGNGKTTLVKEGISKALNRPFEFVALGGASDSSFFDGHNFTYEGSKWGRVIDILMRCKYMNPVIYFDELDKVSETYKGEEIINLLTHLTDTSQNTCFHDNYFTGIDFDLSKVLFIFSFNDESKINRILKDRMTVINTKGFKIDDKLKIANEYLLPELLKTYKYNGTIIFTDNILTLIIDKYTNNEEGVRNLKRSLETIISKINIYEILFNNDSKDPHINLPYKFENFKLPYTVTEQDINNILKENNEYKAPEHMYM